MEQKFTVAGTAAQHGVTKVRFANDLVSRIKILVKNKCENINLIELPEPMTKLEALKYLHDKNIPGEAGVAIAKEFAKRSKRAVADLVKEGPAVAQEAVA